MSGLSRRSAMQSLFPVCGWKRAFMSMVQSVSMLLSLVLWASVVDAQPRPRVLARSERGVAAIKMLGTRLPEVAKRHGMGTRDLEKFLRKDTALVLDPTLSLFYADPAPLIPQGGESTEIVSNAVPATLPLSETFRLHSRLGASRVIYLDFDGHVLSGTGWNAGFNSGADINAPAWDIDGDPTSFNEKERIAIQEIWARVAEDFAPFDVDVTTEYLGEAALTRSSSSDQSFGTRALISPISSFFGSYGGIAYIGVFSSVGDYYKPALVFPENLVNGASYIAEAISHEVGHNLGLNHDGTTTGSAYYSGHGSGDTGWAPIMGVGYYRKLTQWSAGEYPNANNTEDDVAKIQLHGIPMRLDDHGDSLGAATLLPQSNTFSVRGVLHSRRDIDVFTLYSPGGTLSVDAQVSLPGANADLQISVLDGQGTTVAWANPVGQTAASLIADLPMGSFFLVIDGVGEGSETTGYSDYGSLGQYELAGSFGQSAVKYPPVAQASSSVQGGDAPVAVQFIGSGSTDSDGSIVGHMWDFGDGTSATSADVAHVYSMPGTYTARLTVTDNDGLTDVATVVVTVTAPNVLPTANLSVSGTQGQAPLTVQFDASASVDPDGDLVSYEWTFGDGATQITSTPMVSHTYQVPGSFAARVTVVDNRGARHTSPVQTILVAGQTVRVSAITLRRISRSKLEALVTVTDGAGRPISNATVQGIWSGIVSGSSTSTTSDGGTARFTRSFSRRGTATFSVSNVSKSGVVYDASQNIVTTRSLQIQ